MRVLVITQNYAPDLTAGAYRLTEMTELLTAMGHEVQVLTARPHRAVAAEDRSSSTGPAADRPQVARVPIYGMGGHGLSAYLLHYFSFVAAASIRGLGMLAFEQRPDVVWASSPPLFVGLVGVLISRFASCPLVLDVRDIWPESAVAVGLLRGCSRPYRIGRRLECWLYVKADAMTSVTEAMADYLRGYTNAPVEAIYNGRRTAGIGEQGACRPCGGRGPVVRYVGNLGRMHELEIVVQAFLEARDQLASDQPWRLELIGAGVEEVSLRALIRCLGVEDRVEILPPVSRRRADELMASASVLVLHVRASPVFELTIPAKLFDYLAAGRPIVAALKGEGRRLLSQTGGNVLCDPGDQAGLVRGLRQAMGDPQALSRLAVGNADVVREGFNREAQAVRLDSFLRRVASRGKTKDPNVEQLHGTPQRRDRG